MSAHPGCDPAVISTVARMLRSEALDNVRREFLAMEGLPLCHECRTNAFATALSWALADLFAEAERENGRPADVDGAAAAFLEHLDACRAIRRRVAVN